MSDIYARVAEDIVHIMHVYYVAQIKKVLLDDEYVRYEPLLDAVGDIQIAGHRSDRYYSDSRRYSGIAIHQSVDVVDDIREIIDEYDDASIYDVNGRYIGTDVDYIICALTTHMNYMNEVHQTKNLNEQQSVYDHVYELCEAWDIKTINIDDIELSQILEKENLQCQTMINVCNAQQT